MQLKKRLQLLKKNFYFFAASLFIAFCGACSQDDGEVYNLDGRVYFYEQKKQGNDYVAVTSKSYSFALQNSALMEDTLRIKVRLMGYVVDYDRTFSADIVSDGTTAVEGTHYKLLPGVLKAGTYESYLPVILYRTADTKDHTVSLNLRLSADAELPAFTIGLRRDGKQPVKKKAYIRSLSFNVFVRNSMMLMRNIGLNTGLFTMTIMPK